MFVRLNSGFNAVIYQLTGTEMNQISFTETEMILTTETITKYERNT